MSARSGFVIGIAFTVGMFTCLLLGITMGIDYTEQQFKKNAKDDSVQNVEVEED